jgi:polyisoprenoid-binding protein YceI
MKKIAPVVGLIVLLALVVQVRAGDTYKVDPVHSSIIFRIKHMNISNVFGRFNEPTGTFVIDDADPTKTTLNFEIQAANVDTHNAQRDTHLKGPDFFNAKQFPTITFKSTAVKKGEGNMLDVTGDLALHGVTRSITVPVEITGQGDFAGSHRVGLETTLTIKRSEYDMKNMVGPVGDDVRLNIAFEGAKQ